MLKQQVELRVRQAHRLGQPVKGPDEKQEVDAGPEEAALGPPVPIISAYYFWHQRVGHEAGRVVGGARKGDRLDAQAGRRDLGHDGVAGRADGQLEDEEHHDDEGADRPRCLGGCGRDPQAADDHENHKHATEAGEVQRSTADVGHDVPRNQTPNKADARLPQVHTIRALRAQTSLLHRL